MTNEEKKLLLDAKATISELTKALEDQQKQLGLFKKAEEAEALARKMVGKGLVNPDSMEKQAEELVKTGADIKALEELVDRMAPQKQGWILSSEKKAEVTPLDVARQRLDDFIFSGQDNFN